MVAATACLCKPVCGKCGSDSPTQLVYKLQHRELAHASGFCTWLFLSCFLQRISGRDERICLVNLCVKWASRSASRQRVQSMAAWQHGNETELGHIGTISLGNVPVFVWKQWQRSLGQQCSTTFISVLLSSVRTNGHAPCAEKDQQSILSVQGLHAPT